MRRLKTARRPPIYPKTPGHLPCSSLTHPLPLSSRRPSVSFGGFGLRGPVRRLKTVRRPPIYPKTPGHLPCSSLTHPLPLSSRRPSVSFGGFGLRGPVRRLKTVRRPPIYPKTPGHLPCSSLTHPLPLSSRRPSVSFGGFGLITSAPSESVFGDGVQGHASQPAWLHLQKNGMRCGRNVGADLRVRPLRPGGEGRRTSLAKVSRPLQECPLFLH